MQSSSSASSSLFFRLILAVASKLVPPRLSSEKVYSLGLVAQKVLKDRRGWLAFAESRGLLVLLSSVEMSELEKY